MRSRVCSCFRNNMVPSSVCRKALVLLLLPFPDLRHHNQGHTRGTSMCPTRSALSTLKTVEENHVRRVVFVDKSAHGRCFRKDRLWESDEPQLSASWHNECVDALKTSPSCPVNSSTFALHGHIGSVCWPQCEPLMCSGRRWTCRPPCHSELLQGQLCPVAMRSKTYTLQWLSAGSVLISVSTAASYCRMTWSSPGGTYGPLTSTGWQRQQKWCRLYLIVKHYGALFSAELASIFKPQQLENR